MSKAQNACAGGPSAATETRARLAIAGHLGEIMNHAPGPACLARKRLDLNRQQSKLAEIKNVERTCSEAARHSSEMQLSMDLRINAIRQSRELARNADWVLIEQPGQTLLFVKPDVSDPSDARAADTGIRCSRSANDLDAQIACIEQDGFELVR